MGMKRQHDSAMQDAGLSMAASVLCCSCGVPIVPNQAMRCAQCLKSEVSIVEGIPRQVVLQQCRSCNRYLKPPWTACEPESRELLGICLKRIKGLGKEVRLIDASFIWTEEHSKRVKVKLTVQKEVENSSVLQQTMVVEFQIVNQQCDDCKKSFTPHTFNAIAQVRQKVTHRRTFLYLEQLIMKHNAHNKVVSLKESREGLDFHFAQRSHAQHFVDFISSWVPTRTRNSKHLLTHDANSNVYQYKYTMACDICPICADDLVFVPRGHSALLSGADPLMLCQRVTNSIRLISPLTLRVHNIPTPEYWKRPLDPVCTRAHLTEFIVLNVELLKQETPAETSQPSQRGGRSRFALADVEIARAADLGVNDDSLVVRTHLGNMLKPGQRAYGYDLRSVNISGLDTAGVEEQMQRTDVILVRKLYKRRKGRAWDVQRLDKDRDEGEKPLNDEADMEAMKQDLEEDPEMRRHVNMFKKEANNKNKPSSTAAEAADEDDGEEEDDEDGPEVPLAELLEGMVLVDETPTVPAGPSE